MKVIEFNIGLIDILIVIIGYLLIREIRKAMNIYKYNKMQSLVPKAAEVVGRLLRAYQDYKIECKEKNVNPEVVLDLMKLHDLDYIVGPKNRLKTHIELIGEHDYNILKPYIDRLED